MDSISRRAFFVGTRAARAPAAAARQVAWLERELCVAAAGGDCRLCIDACAGRRAIVEMDGVPLIDGAACDGCGDCALRCATATRPPAIWLEACP